ncbi:NYN domain-containing protein [bacterium]|nr:NYN domain-containing protein [bacterium]
MSRLAIFVDGGYMDKLGEDEFQIRIDMSKFVDKIREIVESKARDQVDILRTLYYHCLPYQSNPPKPDEKTRFANKRRFFDAIGSLPRFEVRQGRLILKGFDAKGHPIFQQKKVDLLLGLDFALLSGKKQVSHAAVVSGDGDLVPAFKVAKEEGVLVWLFHGPNKSRIDGSSTFAHELWIAADERCEIDSTFMKSVERTSS